MGVGSFVELAVSCLCLSTKSVGERDACLCFEVNVFILLLHLTDVFVSGADVMSLLHRKSKCQGTRDAGVTSLQKWS